MRYFTPEEANQLLPEVRGIVDTLLACRDRVLELRDDLWPAVERAASNGGTGVGGPVLGELMELRRGLAALKTLGVELKDLNDGLVDFPARRKGTDVYLCWRHGEERVSHWHDPEDGFAGRRPIEPGDW